MIHSPESRVFGLPQPDSLSEDMFTLNISSNTINDVENRSQFAEVTTMQRLSQREMIQIGGIGLFGLTLPNLL
jgi:hypothetical protein